MVEEEATMGHDVGDVGAATVARETLLASGPTVSSVVSPVFAPPTMSCEGGCIILPFVERSRRCVILPTIPLWVGVIDVFS